VSSHLMSEMALTVDHVVVIGRGRVIAQMPTSQFLGDYAQSWVLVRTADPRQLSDLLRQSGASVTIDAEGTLIVQRISVGGIGQLAAAHHMVVLELSPQHASLEDAYVNLTRAAAEFRGVDQPTSVTDMSR
jgi:ABC-2 type transport system ATP-binding protein